MSNFVKDMTVFNEDIDYVKRLIPNNSRMNFERNLCFLRMGINNIETKYLAGYSSKKNQIDLCRKAIEESKKSNLSYFKNFFKYIMRHELLHVACSRYDKKKNIKYSGFCVEYLNKGEEEKTELFPYLQDGFIDLLLSKDYPNTIYKYSIYVPLVDTLTEIVGMDLMKETFFNSKGIKPIKDKLKEYGIEEEKINDFFNSFNNIEHNISQENISAPLPNIQNMLLHFYLKKIDKIESKEELIISKLNFSNKLNKFIKIGEDLHNYLGMDTTFYRFITKDIKAKVKSI